MKQLGSDLQYIMVIKTQVSKREGLGAHCFLRLPLHQNFLNLNFKTWGRTAERTQFLMIGMFLLYYTHTHTYMLYNKILIPNEVIITSENYSEKLKEINIDSLILVIGQRHKEKYQVHICPFLKGKIRL